MGNLGKALSVVLVLIFLTSLVILQPATVKAASKTITVPDDYPTIQAAVGNASSGDTVFVKKGIYHIGALNIDKSLSLIGEDLQKTTINGDREKYYPHNWGRVTISIMASDVLIAGFTITNCENAISNPTKAISALKINGNNIENNFKGIFIDQNIKDCLIDKNFIRNNSGEAIAINGGNEFRISRNMISSNWIGISASGIRTATLSDNDIVDNSFGLSLIQTSNADIYGNTIKNNTIDTGYYGSKSDYGYGIDLFSNNNTIIHHNIITENNYGINLRNFILNEYTSFGFGNVVYQNNFVSNSKNANVEHRYPYNVTDIINGTAKVSWDNCLVGNFWSDYQGQGTYVIDENNIDRHPLTQPVDITTTAPTLLTIAIIAIVLVLAVVVSLLLYKRHRKTT